MHRLHSLTCFHLHLVHIKLSCQNVFSCTWGHMVKAGIPDFYPEFRMKILNVLHVKLLSGCVRLASQLSTQFFDSASTRTRVSTANMSKASKLSTFWLLPGEGLRPCKAHASTWPACIHSTRRPHMSISHQNHVHSFFCTVGCLSVQPISL